MDDDRQFSIGSVHEYAGVLDGGRRFFQVTPERVEISDATGTVVQTIDAREQYQRIAAQHGVDADAPIRRGG